MKRHPMHGRAGFSLIELLVAMVIGLVVTLAVTSVLIRSEGSKRSSTSVNDLNQTGAHAAFVLDRAIRSAGSGYSQRWADVYGCLLDVRHSGAVPPQLLPIPAALPATSAFRGLTNAPALQIRLAPLIIAKDLADTTGAGAEVRGDILLVMGGTAGVGEAAQAVLPLASPLAADNLRLDNTLGYRDNDLVLLANRAVPAGCMLQQVASRPAGDYGQSLPLAGNYFHTGGGVVALADFPADTLALQLGRDVANPPQFQAYAVGANRTLFAYDLLLPATGAARDVPVADSVVEMRAVYGLDTTGPTGKPDGILDSWTDATGLFAASALTDGSVVARERLRQIVAVRIGLILRTALQERAAPTSASGVTDQETYQQASGTVLALFGDLPAAVQRTRALGSTELGYRFRTVEITIPLRNVLMAPLPP